jgi:hypothetical protein
MYAPIESGSQVLIVYSKKTVLHNHTNNREALVYLGRRMCMDPWFWSFFHSSWYRSVYLLKRKPVVETKWVNWVWMAS